MCRLLVISVLSGMGHPAVPLLKRADSVRKYTLDRVCRAIV